MLKNVLSTSDYHRQRDTNVYNLVVSPTSEGGQIHCNTASIRFMPTLHFNQQRASSLLKLTFTLSSSTCFFHVIFGLSFFLWPSTTRSNALLKMWPSSLLNTWPYQWTLFARDNWSMVSYKPSMNIKSVNLFLSLSCTPHIALIMDLSILPKFSSHFPSGTMLHFHTVLPALHNSYKQPLLPLEEIFCQAATHSTP